MDKFINRLSNLILLTLVAGSYWLWVVGLQNPYVQFVYDHSAYICLFTTIFLLIIRFNQLTKSDIGIILMAFILFIIYFFTTASPNPTTPLVLPTILLLLLCYKKTLFDSFDYLLLLGISIVSLMAVLFRLYRITKVGEPFWINSNTLGMTVLFSTITIVILLKSFNIGLLKDILIGLLYMTSLIAIWILSSDTTFILLILFGILDNFIPKKLFQASKSNFSSIIFALIVAVMPLISYLIAYSQKIDLFSGREKIWNEFFNGWLSDPKAILLGKEPFYASTIGKGELGIHNGYLSVLANFGLIGYFLFFGFLLYLLYKAWSPKLFHSKREISFLIGFFCICIHGMMEKSLVASSWFPILYMFVGLTISEQKPPVERKTRRSSNY